MELDPYRTLDVDKTATQAEIKSAYRKLARENHPDRSSRADAAQRMAAINRAYQTVGDPASRAVFDHRLADEERPGSPDEQQAEGWFESISQELKCTRCGTQDSSLRIVAFPWVFSLLILAWSGESGGLLCRPCQSRRASFVGALTGVFGWWGLNAFPRAVEALWKAVTLQPRMPAEPNARLLRALGALFLWQGRVEEARMSLTEASRLGADASALLAELGGSLTPRQGGRGDVMRFVERAFSAALGPTLLLAMMIAGVSAEPDYSPSPRIEYESIGSLPSDPASSASAPPRGSTPVSSPEVSTPAREQIRSPSGAGVVTYLMTDGVARKLVGELHALEREATAARLGLGVTDSLLTDERAVLERLEAEVEKYHRRYPGGEIPSPDFEAYERLFRSYEAKLDGYNRHVVEQNTEVASLKGIVERYETKWAELEHRAISVR